MDINFPILDGWLDNGRERVLSVNLIAYGARISYDECESNVTTAGKRQVQLFFLDLMQHRLKNAWKL